MRIVLLGAPGSGKGTQSQRLVKRHGIPQISTGDLLRATRDKDTELGRKVKAVMDLGLLVDDEIVLGMVRERLAEPDTQQGFIFDGFPRNLAQGKALDSLLGELGKPLDRVVQMDVDYGEIVRRIAGRRTCSNCKRVFNLLTCPPGQAENEICPATGGPHQLFQRPDDKEETVTERLRVYDEQTKPLIEFYREQGILRSIDAEGDLDEVTERLEKALGAWSDAPAKPGSGAKAVSRGASTNGKSAATKKKAGRKSGAGKGVAAKGAAKKAPVKKAPAKKSGAKKAPLKKAAAKKAPGKKAPAKKTPGKKAPTRKTAAKKAVGKKAAAKKGRGKR
jgi:adenylate kinase